MLSKKMLPYIIVVGVSLALVGLLKRVAQIDLDEIRNSYIDEQKYEVELVADKVEEAFKAFYQGLRTMTQLPGVRSIDRYGKSFQDDSKKAVQQIYNNTYVNVTLSEVYLLPSSLDPDKIDPKTGKAEEPIITFDEFIVGGAAKKEEAVEGGVEIPEEELEELEIEEYRLMRDQLTHLRTNYPKQSSIDGLNFPAISGPPVITCDNSEFTKKDLDSGNDKPRMGLVYTLPFYDMNGNFAGGVSGVVRINVLERLIPESSFAIINPAIKYKGVTNPSEELKSSEPFFMDDKENPNLIFSEVRKLDVVDTTPWTLVTALPNEKFYSLKSVKQVNTIFWGGVGGIVLLALGAMAAIRSAQRTEAVLEHKVQVKTSELSHRNVAMKLILDNAEEGFMTCELNGRINSEYSAAVAAWFGAPTSELKIWQFIHKTSEKKQNMFRLGWDQLVEEFMPFDVTADQLGSPFQVEQKWFKTKFTAIRDEAGKLKRIMVVVQDVTRAVEAEEREKQQQELLAVFGSLTNDRAGFLEFFADAENMVKTLSVKKLDKDEQFRLIHTLKGNCSQYSLTTVADLCHELETLLSDGEGALSAYQITTVKDVWDDTAKRLTSLVGKKDSKVIELRDADYQGVLKMIIGGVDHATIETHVRRWRMESVRNKFERMAEQTVALADRLMVGDVKCEIDDGGVFLEPEQFRAVFASLVHVVRNSIDHGLSGVEGRTKVVKFVAREVDNQLKISIVDNGNGVNWSRVKEKGQKLGVKCDTQEELIKCLFADGFSTKDEVSSTSGRGVGMSAVLEAAVKAGGRVDVDSKTGIGTSINITLPM
jgi:HPt (histidine-containing phosphotransfer) domain-containing protein